MSDENIISMLTAETLKPADSAGFPDTDVVFQRRRFLSKLPVHAVDGEFFSPLIARFHIDGHVIDMPTNFSVAQFLDGPGGAVTKEEEPEFFSALAPLVGGVTDRIYVTRSAEGNPWLVFWSSSEAGDLTNEIAGLFTPQISEQKNAA